MPAGIRYRVGVHIAGNLTEVALLGGDGSLFAKTAGYFPGGKEDNLLDIVWNFSLGLVPSYRFPR